MQSEEGYIKFICQHVKTGPVIPEALFIQLNRWRDQLYSLDMLGVTEEGIGFGNLSARKGDTSQFYISGSATGKYRHAESKHFALVTAYDFKKNTLTCRGPVQASSESLSHAAIYEADAHVHSVIHVHHRKLWEYGMSRSPTTDPASSFGTPEIAEDISRLLQQGQVREGGILVMGGHPEGILFFGHSPDDAGRQVLEYLSKMTLL